MTPRTLQRQHIPFIRIVTLSAHTPKVYTFTSLLYLISLAHTRSRTRDTGRGQQTPELLRDLYIIHTAHARGDTPYLHPAARAPAATCNKTKKSRVVYFTFITLGVRAPKIDIRMCVPIYGFTAKTNELRSAALLLCAVRK